MLEVVTSSGLGNTEKSAQVKNICIAMAEGNESYLLERVSDKITWEFVGERRLRGTAEFKTALSDMRSLGFINLLIENIVIQKNQAVISGRLVSEAHEEFRFSDTYQFNNTRFKSLVSILSFVIEC